jgi:hypothetical protein
VTLCLAKELSVISQFLLPETVARQDGKGPDFALDDSTSLLLTLGVNRIVEQEALDLTIWGSADGETWKQLAAFPQKFYCGTYSMMLDLRRHAPVAYIRAQWKMSRWGRGDLTPLFGFYLFAESMAPAMAAAR